MTSDLAAKALAFASEWHGDQRRKGTDIPYVSHLLAVAALVLEGGGTLELHVPAALLHDVIEDTGATVDDVESQFGSDVAAIVKACSDKDDPTDPPPWIERKARYVEHLLDLRPDALLVSLADKVHNCSAVVDDYETAGSSLWSQFKAQTAGQLWYYRSLLDLFDERRGDLEGFAGERHGREAGGGWLLDRLDRAVCEFERIAEDCEPDAVAESWGFGPGLTCPACQERSVRPIVYGLPGFELAAAEERGAVVLGGCIVNEANPKWACTACRRSYLSLRPLREAPTEELWRR